MFKELLLRELPCVHLLRISALQSCVGVLQDRHSENFITFHIMVFRSGACSFLLEPHLQNLRFLDM